MATGGLPGGRRRFLRGAAAVGGAAALGALVPVAARPQPGRIRIGLMLPYSGTYARLGLAIENGFRLAIRENGGRIAGRELEYFRVDDESDPEKAAGHVEKLVHGAKVDVLVGTVHSGVQAELVQVARETGVLHIIPNAGLNAATGPLCAPNIFRTSFANSQAAYPMGKVLADRRVRRVVTITWKYAAGDEIIEGFKAAFRKGSGRIVRELALPFPEDAFAPALAEIAAIKPDAVFAFFAGGGALKFIRAYHAAGLKHAVPLYGPGFLTDGVLEQAGEAAEGIETTLHYGARIDSAKNQTFRLSFAKAYKRQADVYAVQGYDSGLLLIAGLNAVKGDVGNRAGIIAAMERAEIDSPRGRWRMSAAHNPIQNFYLRRVVGQENRVTGIAVKALDYPPASLCRMR